MRVEIDAAILHTEEILMKKAILFTMAFICIPALLSAEEATIKAPSTMAPTQLDASKIRQVVRTSCPQGWVKTYDITNNKSQWSENSPVLICKPSPSLINCPEGTFFYIGGNENAAGSAGEIGCRTPVW